MKHLQKIKPDFYLALGVFALIIIAMCFLSCRILQNQKNYEHYTTNKVWDT